MTKLALNENLGQDPVRFKLTDIERYKFIYIINIYKY